LSDGSAIRLTVAKLLYSIRVRSIQERQKPYEKGNKDSYNQDTFITDSYTEEFYTTRQHQTK